jgi:hypothetical protein
VTSTFSDFKGRGWFWSALLLAGLASTLALMAASCETASATTLQPGPEWFENLPLVNQHAVTNFLYEQSPQGVVPYGGEAGEISATVSSGFVAAATSDPGYATIATDTTEAETATGLIPPISEAIPVIAAAGTAFYAGWEIGESINAIFLHIGLGEDSAPEWAGGGGEGYEDCVSQACAGHLVWRDFGTSVYFGATVQQSPGAYRYGGTIYYNGKVSNRPDVFRWWGPPCEYSGMTPPPGSTMQTHLATTASCPVGKESFPIYAEYPYVLSGQLLGQETIHKYNALIDGVPTKHSKAPKNPGTATVETRAAEYFDSDERAQRWVDYETDPQDFPNPFITKLKENHDCDRAGGAAYENPGGSVSPEPFAKKEEAPFIVTTAPEGVEPESVYLRWGRTDWLPSRESFSEEPMLDLWGGWGYRHILAKHGWSALDREETAQALIDDVTPILEPNGLWKYEDFVPTPGLEGVECARTVLVEFETGEDGGVPDPAPRGIVTSYNQVVP